jgi:hypothetical protein
LLPACGELSAKPTEGRRSVVIPIPTERDVP